MTTSDEKYALVAYIVKSYAERGSLGKKALQKIVHLLSEIYGISSGYRFQLYTYGPFSRELQGDIDILDSMGVIEVKFDGAKNGYQISPTPNTDILIKKHSDFLDGLKLPITSALDRFGDKLAKTLELSSMLVFIIKHKMVDDIQNDVAVISKFMEVKPHYQKEDIIAGLKEVRALLLGA